MHFQYKIRDDARYCLNDSFVTAQIIENDLLRVSSFLNNNSYSSYPGIGCKLPVFDVVNKSNSEIGIEPQHMKTINEFGYVLEQITEEEYKEAFKKR